MSVLDIPIVPLLLVCLAIAGTVSYGYYMLDEYGKKRVQPNPLPPPPPSPPILEENKQEEQECLKMDDYPHV